jgi:hypothetical protein
MKFITAFVFMFMLTVPANATFSMIQLGIGGTWILTTGSWNDAGTWVDGNVWID